MSTKGSINPNFRTDPKDYSKVEFVKINSNGKGKPIQGIQISNIRKYIMGVRANSKIPWHLFGI
jgi:hypothetical protein